MPVRDESHLDGLARALELERAAHRARHAELQATLPLAERIRKGLAIGDLEAVDEEPGLGGRVVVVLEREGGAPLEGRIQLGDVVELRPRRGEAAEGVRGVVSRRGRARLSVAFDRGPPPLDATLLLELAPDETTFDRARKALSEVRGLAKGREKRKRDVLLGAAAPRFEAPRPLVPGRPLNPEQLEAAALALACEDLFLVHGPPGTGKSTVLAEVAAQAVGQGQRVLCTAASNAAVDHLLELCVDRGLAAIRLGHPARVAERLQRHVLDVVVEEQAERAIARDLYDEAHELLGYARKQRTRGRSRERFANARAAREEAGRLLDEARERERRAVRAVLDRARVVCATLSGLDTPLLAGQAFDLAIVDEATQATEPISLWAFLRAKRVVLAGDHLQLPPTVISPEAARAGLSRSLFERLLEDHGPSVKRMLREQHRMHEGIMRFPSEELYGGELRAHPSVARHTLDGLLPGLAVDAPPLLFLDTAGKGFFDETPPGSESRQNPGEAELVVARAKALLDAGLPAASLGVITPYAAQAELLRDRLPPEVEVDTVDAFQGREKEAILVSLVRSNEEGELGFLEDLRRMNVAITRARRHLFVVGDAGTLSRHAFYARFVERAQADGGYRTAWDWPEAP